MTAVLSSSGAGRAASSSSLAHHRRGPMYLAGLDGVRALAVGGVLLYHSEMPWFQGGFLGVDVFFVLSGFLITALLAREFDAEERLALRSFYARRFRRLVPAVLLLLGTTLILSAFFVPDAAPRVRGDGLAALFYVSNWWLIASGQSYFEFISRPPLLQHLWSLGIEEQFYLLWPVAVWMVLRAGGRRGLAALALAGAAASTVWMAMLAASSGYPDADPSRIYFGTDTHCMGLLLGAALAAVWQPWTAGALSRRANGRLALLGLASSAAVAWGYVQVGERSPLLYTGGFLLLSMAVCGLIVAVSHPASTFGHLLGRQPLRWIGERSYGLYLWHWPVYVVTRPGLDVRLTGGSNLLLRLAVTCALAELSYRFIERPIRNGAIGRFVEAWRTAAGPARRPLVRRAAIAGVPAAAMLVLAVLAVAMTPTAKAGGDIAADVAEAMGIANGGPTKVTITRLAVTPDPASASDPGSVATGGRREPGGPAATTGIRISTPVNNGGLTAIGDSVLLGVRVHLEKSIRGVQMDAEVGRQPWGVLDRVRDLQADNLLAPTVLMHLGTNGYVTEKQLRRSLAALPDRRVILVNAHAPRQWVAANNEMLARVVRDYPNVALLDWAAESVAHPEFYVSDDIHLSTNGQRAFVEAVKRVGNFPVVTSPAPGAAPVALKSNGVETVPAALEDVETGPTATPEPASTVSPETAPALADPAPPQTPPSERSVPPDTPETPVEPSPQVTLPRTLAPASPSQVSATMLTE